MKRCPKCNLQYSDPTLEFCLEDGSRLLSLQANETEIPTVTLSNKQNPLTEKTANLPFSVPETLEVGGANSVSPAPQKDLLQEKFVRQSDSVLEIAPIVVALAHNWWQWIYLDGLYYSSFTNYVLSANFLMWLLLLIAGALVGLYAVKRCQNRAFSFVSLVILSINLILFLVPRK